MNLDDIARLAGVSRTTVSRVINDRPDVSPVTRQKVLEIIETYKFHPNPVARMLASQRTRIIGVAICDPSHAFQSYYSSILFHSISTVTKQRDYATLIWWQEFQSEEDRFAERILQQNRLMDGMLVTSVEIDTPLIDYLLALQIPFVMLEKPARREDEICYVTIDNMESTKALVQHLITLGHTRIAHIVGMASNMDAQERLWGYQETLEANGIRFDPDLIAVGSFSRQSGYEAMQELLARDIAFDAVFAGNDHIAHGALQALKQAGRRVPEDVGLVGFDDIPLAHESVPELTTVHQPIYERGAKATSLLLDMVEGAVAKPFHIVLPTHLVIRQSCGST